MEFIVDSLRADWETFLRLVPRLIYGLLLLMVFIITATVAGRMLGKTLRSSRRLAANARFFQLALTWTIASIGVLLALGIVGFQGVVTSLMATGGIAAIILGFAFREVGENFLAGFFLTFSRPFEIGDLIKTGDLLGTVRSIELRYVHVRTFDACDVYVPSAQLFREPLYNFTKDGLRRPNFTIGVAYHDDPETVIALLEETVAGVAGVLAEPEPFVTVKNFGAQYVEYDVFFFIDVEHSDRGYIATKNDVKVACWRALRDAEFTFSTDVSSAIELRKLPGIDVTVTGESTLPSEE